MVCTAGAATSINSFKAASTARVSTDSANKLWGSRSIGNCDFCPKSAQYPIHDASNRPLGGNAKRVLSINDPSCACFIYPLKDKIRHENAERMMIKCSQDYMGNM